MSQRTRILAVGAEQVDSIAHDEWAQLTGIEDYNILRSIINVESLLVTNIVRCSRVVWVKWVQIKSRAARRDACVQLSAVSSWVYATVNLISILKLSSVYRILYHSFTVLPIHYNIIPG